MKDDKKDKQFYRFQLTINNPTNFNMSHDTIRKTFIQNFKTFAYLCMADEKGSCLHTHIFVCFTSRVRFSTIKKHFPTAHIEIVKGTIADNIAYIKKSGKWENHSKHGTIIDGTFEELGTPPPESKGKKAEMTDLYQMILDGLTNAEILAINQDYILQIDKLDKLRTIILTEKYKGTRRLDLKVTYMYGATGTGKTRGILDLHGDENVYRVTDYQHPFDGYNCQPVIVFDEFRSSLMLKDMLNYCDIYPIELPARFSNKYACYLNIYIVSNWELKKQYSELQQNDNESWEAFLRRIHSVKIYEKDKILEFNSIQSYFDHITDFHKPTKEEQKEIEQCFQESIFDNTK